MGVSKIIVPVFCNSMSYRVVPGRAGRGVRAPSPVGEAGSWIAEHSLGTIGPYGYAASDIRPAGNMDFTTVADGGNVRLSGNNGPAARYSVLHHVPT